MYLTYKYRLYPNNNQKERIEFIISCSNMVRNMCITNNDIELARKNSKDLLESYIKLNPELKMCDYSALINSLWKTTDEKNSLQKNSKSSYTTTYSQFLKEKYPITNKRVFISKVGYVRYKKSREFPKNSNLLSFTIKRDNLSNYFLLVSLSAEKSLENKELNIEKSIGLDYSSPHLMVDNNGKRYDLPESIKELNKLIRKKNKILRKKERGSSRYKQTKNEINKLYAKFKNIRTDYFYKLANEFVKEYDYVFVETLDMKSISKKYNLQRSTERNAYATFLKILEYKLKANNKKIIRIDKWYASTKTCHVCGNKEYNLSLKNRYWICNKCGAYLDRDVNAAINIRLKGMNDLKSPGRRCVKRKGITAMPRFELDP